jgi:co-chaperonin GroES (HSP10)
MSEKLSHPDRFIVKPLKSQTSYGRFVVPDFARHRTMYARVEAVPSQSDALGLGVGDVVIYDTQGNFREVGEELLSIKGGDLIAKVATNE